MMKGIVLAWVGLGALAIGGCGRGGGEGGGAAEGEVVFEELRTEEAEEFVGRGRDVAMELVTNLGTQLKASLEAGGAESALVVCQQMAQPITAATGRDDPALAVRRTSMRWRNPANAPDEVDRAILEAMERQMVGGDDGAGPGGAEGLERVVRGPDGVVRYYRPLVVQALCVQCHGGEESLAPGLAATLERLYPDDRAVGYEEGDLRGAVVVEWRR